MARGAQNPSIRRVDLLHLSFILLIALVHGLIYVFLVPPWQHYDEPNHFEYAWLVANRGSLPQAGDKDQSLNYAIFSSLIKNGYFGWMDELPVLGLPDEPVKIPGYSQLSEPPLYYLVASIPLRMVPESAIEIQLYGARLTSLVMYMLVIIAAWGTMIELTKPGHPLRWMTPMTLAFLPSLVDIMTAVNSDAGAIALGSLFFWGSVRLIRRGFSLIDFIWATISAGLCYYTKNIAVFTLILLPVVLLFSILRDKFRWLAWVTTGVGFALLLAVSFVVSDAAFWYRASSQSAGTREKGEPAILGDYVLAIDVQAPAIPEWFPPVFQSIPVKTVEALQGKDISLGFWVWSDQPMEIRLPIFDAQGETVTQNATVGPTPQFVSYHFKVPESIQRIWIDLNPGLAGAEQGWVYFDGMVLAQGIYPENEAPQFADIHGSRGNWGGQVFTNVLRNPSFETPAPRIRAEIDNFGVKILPDRARPSLVLMYFMDWAGMQDFLRLSLNRLHRSFWAEFGWGNVPLQVKQMYVMLAVVGMAAIAAALIGMLHQRRVMPWDVILFFALALLISWSTTLSRGFGFMVQYKFYVPVARHTYPSIIPLIAWLTFGWLQIFRWIINSLAWFNRTTKLFPALQSPEAIIPRPWIQIALYSLPWMILAFLAVTSITNFYNP